MFGFRTAKVFDPSWTLLRAGGAAAVSLLLLWLFGPVGGVLGLAAVLWWLFHLSRADRQLVTAIAVRIHELDIAGVLPDGSGQAEVRIRSGVVARVDRRLRPHSAVPLAPGRRVLQLALQADSTCYLWVEGGTSVELDASEASGALDVVLSGDDIRIDYLVGGLPGMPPKPIAVNVYSSVGSLVSYDPVVQPKLDATTTVADQIVGEAGRVE